MTEQAEAVRRAERRGRERARTAAPTAEAEPSRLVGAAAASHAAAVAAERERGEAVERLQALTRTVVKALARMTGLPGPDALVLVAGPEDARRILALGWDQELPQVPVVRQSSSNARPWAGDPEHDPRVLNAIARGASGYELAAIRRELEQEKQAARPQPSNVLWQTRTGVLTDGTQPFQQHSSVPRPYPDHDHLPQAEED